MTKILIVHSSYPHNGKNYGGAKKMITWLGNNLSEKGCNVTFCSIYDIERPDSLGNRTNYIELKINRYKSFLKRNLLFFILFYKRIKLLFNKEQFDYVISFGETSYFVLLFLKYIYRYKLIVSERADPNHNNGLFDIIRRLCYRYSDIVVCQSGGAKQCFHYINSEKIKVIPNPITIPEYEWAKEKSEKTIATSGRLYIKQKRQDILLEAFSIVHKKYPEYKLHIYGDGPDYKLLKAYINKLGLDSSVTLFGCVKCVQQKLKDDGVFVLTSDYEGVPNALLEAMAIGMPCISTKCSPGGAEMLIQNNKNGYLIECGNINDIADCISSFIDNKELAQALGKEARISIRKFDPQIIINNWIEIL